MNRLIFVRLAASTVLLFGTIACGSSDDAGDESAGALENEQPQDCTDFAVAELRAAAKAAEDFVKYENAWTSWEKDSAGKTAETIAPIPNVTPTDPGYHTCIKLSDTLEQSLQDLDSAALLAASPCNAQQPAQQKLLKSDPAFGAMRTALARTLSLAVATGQLTADGKGFSEALARGVDVYQQFNGRKVSFEKGSATIFAPGGAGLQRDWVKERTVPYTVSGTHVKFEAAELALQIDTTYRRVTLVPTENSAGTARDSELYDYPNECWAKH